MENNKSPEKKNTLIIVGIITAVVIGVLVIILLPIIFFFNSYNSTKKDFQEEYDKYSSIIENGKEETSDIRKEMKVNDFNDELGIFKNEYDGIVLKKIISTVIESNNKNINHKVTVTYKGSDMSSAKQLNDLITKIDSNKEYTITKEYDEDGYIVIVIIK